MPVNPNFIVIGSMKSGTTTLYHFLGQHPDVFISTPKEPEYFCKDDVYARGWDWYQGLFAHAKTESALGEGSSSYTKAPLFPNVPERIARHIPQARLLYIARHPIERIESHWMHRVRHGDARSFNKMLREYPNLVDTSRYWFQIQQYRKYFSDEQILVLFFDDLKENPEAVVEKCFRFIGVDPGFKLADPSERRHVTRQFKIESDLLKRVKANSALSVASRFISVNLKNLMKKKLEIRVKGRPARDKEMRHQVISEIANDMRTFLDFYSKPVDYWDMNSDQTCLST